MSRTSRMASLIWSHIKPSKKSNSWQSWREKTLKTQMLFSSNGTRLTTQKCFLNKNTTLMPSKRGSISQCSTLPKQLWRSIRSCLVSSLLRFKMLRLGRMMFFSMRQEIPSLTRFSGTFTLIFIRGIRREDMLPFQVFCKELRSLMRSTFQWSQWLLTLESPQLRSLLYLLTRTWLPFSMSLDTSCTTCALKPTLPDSLEQVWRETS